MTKKLVDFQRRKFLGVTGGGLAASVVGTTMSGFSEKSLAQKPKTVRWGFVGTGNISNRMAAAIQKSDNAELVAISSRKMASAEAFATKHNVGRAFDSWAEMMAWDGVDAIYVATPTSVKEEICVAAANHRKHVLGDKPFASLSSVKNITAACRKNAVGFMDGTHFVHTARTKEIKETMQETTGWPWSLSSAFQFKLHDKTNIRFNTKFEPQGAVGDAGWYCMRAAVEFLSPNIELSAVNTFLRRDEETGAAISASGVLQFSDGSTSTWNVGFDSGATMMDLRLTGSNGVIKLEDFIATSVKNSSYRYLKGGNRKEHIFDTEVTKSGATLQFQNYAAMIQDPTKIEASMEATEKTQLLLDRVWQSGVANES